MGRHSAPDDGDDAPSALAVRERDDVVGSGRHAYAMPEQDAVTDAGLPPAPPDSVPDSAHVSAPDSSATAATDSAVPGAERPRRATRPQVSVKDAAHNSAADLHLVRTNHGVLAWCCAAVLVPFVVYVVLVLLLSDLTAHRFLIWIWAPLVAAGVLLGIVLDVGHRRHGATAALAAGEQPGE